MKAETGKPAKSGAFPALIGVALSAVLLGALIIGYFAWGEGNPLASTLGQNREAPVTAATSNAAINTATPASPAATPLAEADASTVEQVTEQQGGLEQRLAAAEQRLARLDLQAQAASGNAGRAEGLLVAFAARRTLERGEQLGYLADQLRLRFGMAQPDAVRLVISASQDPIRLDQLIARLEGLQSKLVTTDGGPSFERLKREISDLFVIRREATPSTRPDRALYRARLSLESGRVEKAIAEVESLPGAANASDWIADARRYAALQNALNILETSAIIETSGLRDNEGQVIKQPSPAALRPDAGADGGQG